MNRFIKLNNVFFASFQDNSLLGFMARLIFHADHRNNAGTLLYNGKRLAETFGMTDRHFRRNIKELKDMNEIEVLNIWGKLYIHILNYALYTNSQMEDKNVRQSATIVPPTEEKNFRLQGQKCPSTRTKMSAMEDKNVRQSHIYNNTNVYNKNEDKSSSSRIIDKMDTFERGETFSKEDDWDSIVNSETKESSQMSDEEFDEMMNEDKKKNIEMENNNNFYEEQNTENRYSDKFVDAKANNTISGYNERGEYIANEPTLVKPNEIDYTPTYAETHYEDYVSKVIEKYTHSEDYRNWIIENKITDFSPNSYRCWCEEFIIKEARDNRDHLCELKGDGSLFFRKLTKHFRNYIRIRYKKYKSDNTIII